MSTSTKPEPVVSVKMITYNHAPYIREAVESVLSQNTSFPYELVVGEDCSTDGTRGLVIPYQIQHPDRVRMVTSDTNVGMQRNSYRTLKACRGKYVAFCEGDDYWHNSSKLQREVDFLENHPEYGMVHSGYDAYVDRSGTLIRDYLSYRKLAIPENPDLCRIILECRISFRIQTCTVMVRRDLYEQIVESDPFLHQSGHFLMGDTQLWAEVAAVSKVGFIRESLATYRLLSESASRSLHSAKAFQFELSHAEMLLYLCDKYHLPASVRERVESSLCYTSLRKAFHERDPNLAFSIRRRKPALSPKELLFYFGARNKLAHILLRKAAKFRNSLVEHSVN